MNKIYEKPTIKIIALSSEAVAADDTSANGIKIAQSYQTEFRAISYY